MRLFERAIGALTLVAGAVWSICVLLLGSNAGLPFAVVLVLIWGIAALVVLWVLRVALHLLVTRRAPETRNVRKLLIGPVVWVFCFLLVWTEAAFWLRFQLSKPALDHYAQRASPTIVSGLIHTWHSCWPLLAPGSRGPPRRRRPPDHYGLHARRLRPGI